MARKKTSPSPFWKRGGFWRRIAKTLAILVLIPYPLTLVYILIPPVSTPMLADVLMFKSVRRDWVSIDRISPNLVAAVVASEDGAFCDHYGMDFKQMEKSIKQASARGKPVRGTSTITQQTAKNLFLWNGRSYLRKILEAPLAFWIELLWSKKRIMEVYLNVAQWGNAVYGAEAAAQYHYGVSASALNSGQSALMAAALPSPIKRSAKRPTYLQAMQASVIQRRLASARPDLSCLK